jgi:hypothetical protein
LASVASCRRDSQHGAAVIALQHALVAKLVEVLADRLRGHAEAACQSIDVEPAVVAGERHDIRLPWGEKRHLDRLRAYISNMTFTLFRFAAMQQAFLMY